MAKRGIIEWVRSHSRSHSLNSLLWITTRSGLQCSITFCVDVIQFGLQIVVDFCFKDKCLLSFLCIYICTAYEYLGHVDFYPNGLQSLQPGCITITCAHLRAVEFFAESIYRGNENNFLAKQCSTFAEFKANKSLGREYTMGYATRRYIRGTFFLETAGKSPFGFNAKPNLNTGNKGKWIICDSQCTAKYNLN